MQNEKNLASIRNNLAIGYFPNYFKKIGIGILILFFLPSLAFKLSDASFFLQYKAIFRELNTSVFILGLFFIIWSKEKVENESIQLLRFKALALAFFVTIIRVLLEPLIDLVLGEDLIADTKPTEIISSMLLVYLFIFYISKRARPGDDKNT